MKMKATSVVIEHVLLFFIGVIIFIISFAVFNSYEQHYVDTIMREQLRAYSDWTVSRIILLSEKPDEVNTSISVSMPRFAGREMYEIRLTQQGLNTTSLLSQKSHFTGLYGVNETHTLSGNYLSLMSGVMNITKKGDEITIS